MNVGNDDAPSSYGAGRMPDAEVMAWVDRVNAWLAAGKTTACVVPVADMVALVREISAARFSEHSLAARRHSAIRARP